MAPRNTATPEDAMPTDPDAHAQARELTWGVDLTGPDGRLNPAAVGWARHPLVDTTGIGRGPHRSWGRTKRWEYWNVATPTHVMALTVSSLDYAAVHEVWLFDRADHRTWHRSATVLPARGVTLPPRLDAGVARARAKDLTIDIEPGGSPSDGSHSDGSASSVHLRARIPGAEIDVVAVRPADHECLAVVVPFSATRFQYTVKDVTLPAHGTVRIDGVEQVVPAGESWAVLDHGRGRWPYRARWQWGAGSGVSNGRVVGIQFGGAWTAGTGQTENGVILDGILHKIHDELAWQVDRANYLAPWRIRGPRLDATFTPVYDRKSRTNLGVVSSRTDQCFGYWSGSFVTIVGETVIFDGIFGWAEDVDNRW